MKVHNEELMTAIELLNGETWMTIQVMPYPFFKAVIAWKVSLDEKKRNAMENRHREMEANQNRAATKEKAEARRQQRMAALKQGR